jgi:hypothetical protein
MSIRQDVLDGRLLDKFNGALTPEMIDYLVTATNSVGARREIQKHIYDLRIAPAPDVGERVVRLTGRVKIDGLLGGEEAVRLQLVAGARFGLWKRPLAFQFLLDY